MNYEIVQKRSKLALVRNGIVVAVDPKGAEFVATGAQHLRTVNVKPNGTTDAAKIDRAATAAFREFAEQYQ